MKNRIQPVDRERMLNADDFIVSKTDTKGRISYCNRIFMDIAGYSEHELLGKQHNIVRHPDMPRAVFRLLWDSIKEGREFFGYVKNLCSDGSFYWVFANLTPTYDRDNKLVGYYSVRRCPKRSALDVIQPIYREMLAEEQRAGAAHAVEASTALLKGKLRQYGDDYADFILEI